MYERHREQSEGLVTGKASQAGVNLVAEIFAQFYFPTYSNGLKDVAGWLGFKWSNPNASGITALTWRRQWECQKSNAFRQTLVTYNAEDCEALEIVAQAMLRLSVAGDSWRDEESGEARVVHTELLPHQTMWPRFSSPIPGFEQINKAARWDYQRDKVYVRSSKRLRQIAKRTPSNRTSTLRISKRVICPDQPICPTCGTSGFRHFNITTKALHDVFFSKVGLKRWNLEYRFRFHWCPKCRFRFGQPKGFWPGSKYGQNLIALLLYQIIELGIPQGTVRRILSRLIGLNLYSRLIPRFKASATALYEETRQLTLQRIQQGRLVHVDETRANVRGRTGYVWIFTNLHEVAYLYSDTRDGALAQTVLRAFDGVLVSDFYSAYDSFECRQQKCLLHLMRDLNAEVLSNPYDEQLKQIVKGFAELLQPMVETIDRHGLKRHFLKKHLKFVDRFYKHLGRMSIQSEAALRCKERFERNRGRLFTFLEYDGIPWNNNNAEHAVKAFAALRDIMEGSSTRKGLDEYLVLLGVCQTCKYMGVDFLDFLRSGETDIYAFVESRRRRRRRLPPSESQPSPADAPAGE